MANNNTVKSVEKIFLILESLAEKKGKMKLSELTEELGFPLSTTHRLLSSLKELGYINQEQQSGEYKLGIKFLSLSSTILNNIDLRKMAYPFLKEISDQTDETTNLVVLSAGEALYIEKIESTAPIRVFSMIGKRAPLHATGVGKIFLADMAWSDVKGMTQEKELKKFTPNSITSLQELMEELNRVRGQDYALDEEECELGVWCAAAPVRDYTGKVAASISVSAPVSRINGEKKSAIIDLLKEKTQALSSLLGYQA